MKDIILPTITDNDPLKIQLLDILQKIREEQVILRKTIESMRDNSQSARCEVSVADSPLSLFIHEEKPLVDFIHRLEMCRNSKEWAVHAVYPLYEYGYISAEVAKSKRFIEYTIPYCTNMRHKKYECLKKQLGNHCYFPK